MVPVLDAPKDKARDEQKQNPKVDGKKRVDADLDEGAVDSE